MQTTAVRQARKLKKNVNAKSLKHFKCSRLANITDTTKYQYNYILNIQETLRHEIINTERCCRAGKAES